MKRRDFLLLRTEGTERIVELSCQKLLVHYLDLNSGFASGQPEAGALDEAHWWAGEPPLQIDTTAPDEFFRAVQQEILDADTVCVVDMEWMAQGEFRIRIETLLAAFKAAGGEVQFAPTNAPKRESPAPEKIASPAREHTKGFARELAKSPSQENAG